MNESYKESLSAAVVLAVSLISIVLWGQGCASARDAPSPSDAPEVSEAVEIPQGYVEIPSGSFMQGSPASEEGRRDTEVPQRRVTISRAFALKATPVTQGEWQEIMGNNPSRFSSCGSNCPVEMVSWFDAVEYLNRLSEREGLEKCYEGSRESIHFKGLDCEGYRLPTEAEWEYAARAGTTGARYGDLDQIGWHRGNSGRRTRPVGQKQANQWRLYDMIGNVFEWTWDWYGEYEAGNVTDPVGPSTGSNRVYRGCSWGSDASFCRAASRLRDTPAIRVNFVGFRPARTIP